MFTWEGPHIVMSRTDAQNGLDFHFKTNRVAMATLGWHYCNEYNWNATSNRKFEAQSWRPVPVFSCMGRALYWSIKISIHSRNACLGPKFGFKETIGSLSKGSVWVILISMLDTQREAVFSVMALLILQVKSMFGKYSIHPIAACIYF
jgi:hypothetical protein